MSKIRDLRVTAGMTQEQLAAAVGVTQGAVTQWETGATFPRSPTLRVIAEVLDTTVDMLIDKEDDHETADH